MSPSHSPSSESVWAVVLPPAPEPSRGGFNWSSQHLGRFRRGVCPVGGGPVDGGGGFLGRQCRRGVVQRRPQARNVGGKGFEAVGEYPACPPGGVRLDQPVQHPTSPFSERSSQPARLRAQNR